MSLVFVAVTVDQQGCWTRAYRDVFTACHSDKFRIHVSAPLLGQQRGDL